MPTADKGFLVGVVGPCASGKSTLVDLLDQRGINARDIAQDHSYVPDMWQRITNPDVLIYLDVSYPVSLARREMDWRLVDFEEQVRRLSHARKSADLIVMTDHLSPEQVFVEVLRYLSDLQNLT